MCNEMALIKQGCLIVFQFQDSVLAPVPYIIVEVFLEDYSDRTQLLQWPQILQTSLLASNMPRPMKSPLPHCVMDAYNPQWEIFLQIIG